MLYSKRLEPRLGLAAAAFMGFHLGFWVLVESRDWASVH